MTTAIVSSGCSECASIITDVIYRGLDGEMLCRGCFKDADLTICPNCDGTVNRSDCEKNPDGDLWCEDCLDDKCFGCDNCGCYAWNDDRVSVESYRGHGHKDTDSLCENCANDKTVRCEDCGDIYYVADSVTTADGYDICQSCYEDNYITCEDCGEIVHYDNAHCNDNCCYCTDCNPCGENFNPAGFCNRSGRMTETGSVRCFGVELETDKCDGYTELNGSKAWGAKNDCTVSGKEFYSDILNGDDGLDAIRELGEFANQHGWHAGNSAGYHLHLDMRNESDDSLYAVAYAYRKTQGVWLSFVEGRRHGDGYSHTIRWNCADLDEAIRSRRSFYSYAGGHARCNWCNLCAYQQHTTIEIRLHEGTCNDIEVINWVRVHTRFADWASDLGYEGVREALDGLDDDDIFRLFTYDIWRDHSLSEYYAEKARYHDHGYLAESINLEFCEV